MRTRFRIRVLSAFGALVTALLLVVPGIGAQQGGTVTGRVLDNQSGQPLPAVQVFISSLDLGGLTQQNGRYLLQNVPAGTHTLSVARIGYRTQESQISVGGGQTVEQNFNMAEEALALDEIIVTGTPGGTQRRAIGNTVATVDASDIVADVAISSMQDMLAGRTPGLEFVTNSGNVGTGSGITIRGVTSFDTGRNRPLIYVDGVRVNNSDNKGPTIGENTGNRGQSSSLDDFNPEDIASIEIIKGPAAASLYGTEASAGVIQIITKRGSQGAPEFNVSVRGGTNYMRDPAYRMGTMYYCPTDASPGPVACPNESDLGTYNMYDEGTRYISEGYFDWPTANLFQNGLAQSYNADVRGGTDAIRYFISAGYDDQEGTTWYNTDETFRLRANVGVVFDEHFSMDVSTGYVEGDTRYANATKGDGGIWQDLLWSNGTPLDRVTPFGTPGSNARLGGFQEHLPTDVADIVALRHYSRFTGSATLNFNSGDYNLGSLDGSLTMRAVVGIDKGFDTNTSLYPLEAGPVPGIGGACVYCRADQQDLSQYLSSWSSVYSETLTGEMELTRPIQTNTSWDYAITQNLTTADGTWGFATSLGAQYYTDKGERFGNNGNGFASPLSTTINQLSQSQIVTSFESIENKSLGVYVQQEVSFNERIFVTGAMRFDDNSTFGVDAKALKYPKLSGTWVMSEESFWGIDAVNSFRVRGAWGKAGRQPSSTSGQNIYVAATGPGGQSAVRPSSPGNPAIGPETSTELELGFDFALFDDRLSGEFSNYSRKDKDVLRPIALPSSFGFPGSRDANVGSIKSWGWEALLSVAVYESQALSFDLDLSADYTQNEIKSLGDYAGVSPRIAVGLPYPNLVVNDQVVSAEFVTGGSFVQAFGDRYNAMCDSGISLAPAGEDETKFGRTIGGPAVDCFPSANQNTNLFFGPSFASHTFSVGPRISLFGNTLQINALAEGRYGQYNTDDGHGWGHSYNNSKDSRLLNDPVFVASRRLNGNGITEFRSIYDADFWTLREVGARYTLPDGLSGRIGASRASLAVSARNLFLIWRKQTEVEGLQISDPEYGDGTNLDGSGNFYSLPPLTSLNATLRITF